MGRFDDESEMIKRKIGGKLAEAYTNPPQESPVKKGFTNLMKQIGVTSDMPAPKPEPTAQELEGMAMRKEQDREMRDQMRGQAQKEQIYSKYSFNPVSKQVSYPEELPEYDARLQDEPAGMDQAALAKMHAIKRMEQDSRNQAIKNQYAQDKMRKMNEEIARADQMAEDASKGIPKQRQQLMMDALNADQDLSLEESEKAKKILKNRQY